MAWSFVALVSPRFAELIGLSPRSFTDESAKIDVLGSTDDWHSSGMGLVTTQLMLGKPRDRTVDVHPAGPKIASSIVKLVA